MMFGILGIGLAIAAGVFTFIAKDDASMIAVVIGGLAWGAMMLVAGAFLRMQGALALAVRDIAINSFEKR